jgi:hypothetical protein
MSMKPKEIVVTFLFITLGSMVAATALAADGECGSFGSFYDIRPVARSSKSLNTPKRFCFAMFLLVGKAIDLNWAR